MDSYSWTQQFWLTCRNLHISVLHRHGIPSRELFKCDSQKRQIVRESKESVLSVWLRDEDDINDVANIKADKGEAGVSVSRGCSQYILSQINRAMKLFFFYKFHVYYYHNSFLFFSFNGISNFASILMPRPYL